MNKQTHFGNVVIFGGTGFIGRSFAIFLLEQKLTSTACLVDIKPLEKEHTNTLIKELIDEGCLKIIQWDVRNSSFSSELPNQADLAVNLAAIHREPKLWCQILNSE